MTQPAIDQNTLLAEARQALEKLDRMKAERSRLDLEEKQLRRQLETEREVVRRRDSDRMPPASRMFAFLMTAYHLCFSSQYLQR